MKPMCKKNAIIAAVLILLVGNSIEARAIPTYTIIDSLACDLSISANTANCLADAYLLYLNYSCTLTATLKRSSSANSWVPIASWSASNSGLLGVTIEETIAVASGYSYKLFMTATVRDSEGRVVEVANASSSIQYS